MTEWGPLKSLFPRQALGTSKTLEKITQCIALILQKVLAVPEGLARTLQELHSGREILEKPHQCDVKPPKCHVHRDHSY
jgi:hypothetical protein